MSNLRVPWRSYRPRRDHSTHRGFRPIAMMATLILALLSSMTLFASPASAALSGTGLKPTGTVQNIPAGGPNAKCGIGPDGNLYGEYVKFTTTSGSVDNATANATAGNTNLTVTYSSDQAAGLFKIESLTSTGGSTSFYYSQLIGATHTAPQLWTFDPTNNESPLLAAPVNDNFTAIALCVYPNQTFQVKKVVSGTTTTQSFPITVTCTLGTTTLPTQTVTLSDGQTSGAITVPKGSVCNATDSVTGYTTTSTGPLGPITSDGGLITVTNTRQLASLSIVKNQVGGADRDWHFAVSCSNDFGETFTGSASVTGSGTATVSGIPVGLNCTVTEAEANSAGFTTTVDATGGVVTVGDSSAVTFTNTRSLTKLTVVKDQQGGGARDWTFGVQCSNEAGDTYTGSTTINGSGSATLDGIPTGLDCTVTETGSDVFTTTPGLVQTVNVGTEGTASVTFTNTRNVTDLTINKVQNGGAAQDWHFAVNCPANAAGDSFSGTATINGSGSTTVAGIPTGLSCTVTETEAGVSPFDTTVSPAGGKVSAGGAVTFTNTKRAVASVVKTQNGGAPTNVYTFTLTGGPDGVNKTVSTTPGSTAPLDFGLLKPGTYTLCETGVSAGTKSSLESLPGATVDATLGNVCAPITLTAGNDLTLNIDNAIGEGGRRTIGYWKNWNTCTSNAGQLANAAKTGKKVLDNVLPLTLGSYTVGDCKTGVAILSNASAKYAENALAAQLLAAEANVAVGGAPADVQLAIQQANDLLKTVGYKGSPSSIIGSTNRYRAEAVRLATILDQYNNGLLG